MHNTHNRANLHQSCLINFLNSNNVVIFVRYCRRSITHRSRVMPLRLKPLHLHMMSG